MGLRNDVWKFTVVVGNTSQCFAKTAESDKDSMILAFEKTQCICLLIFINLSFQYVIITQNIAQLAYYIWNLNILITIIILTFHFVLTLKF